MKQYKTVVLDLTDTFRQDRDPCKATGVDQLNRYARDGWEVKEVLETFGNRSSRLLLEREHAELRGTSK